MTTSVSSAINIQGLLLYTLWKFLVCSVCFTSYCSSSHQLQAYALGEMSKGEHPDYSLQGCTADVAITSLRVVSSDVHMYFTIGVIGFVFLVIFNIMASVAFLPVLLKTLLQKIEASNYSFDYYGMFWGISAILYPVLILLLFEDHTYVLYHHQSGRWAKHMKILKCCWPVQTDEQINCVSHSSLTLVFAYCVKTVSCPPGVIHSCHLIGYNHW